MARLTIKSISEPTISRSRPVYVMFDEGIEDWEAQAVFDGLSQVMIAAGTPTHMKVHNFSVWRNTNWLDENGSLTQWNSVDWYLAYIEHHHGRNSQIHGGKLLTLYNEPWQDGREPPLRHSNVLYDVALTRIYLKGP